jgi:hypothetical protein
MQNGKYKEHDVVRLPSGYCGVVEAERAAINIQEWELLVRVYMGADVVRSWHRVSELRDALGSQ